MKRFEIWAEFPDGCEAKVESWRSLKQASIAVETMNAANRNNTACGYGSPHGVPFYTIRVIQ